jgi:hypothetical protein
MDGRGNERRTIRVEIVLVTALWSGAVARPSSTRHEPTADGNRRQSLGHAYTVTCFRLGCGEGRDTPRPYIYQPMHSLTCLRLDIQRA